MSWSPSSAFANAVVAAGFSYDPGQDITYSTKDAWQRKFGYMWAYDIGAAPAHMIIDCEPIYFQYAGKLWMIEFWKGQYGVQTGAEIGVYRDETGMPGARATAVAAALTIPFGVSIPLSVPPGSRFYSCVTTADELQMKFTLFRGGKELFRRGPERHWWLTGFKWGVFTGNTRDLMMDIEIAFPSTAMRDAFKQALTQKRYSPSDRGPLGIAFRFDYPREPQPGARLQLEGGVQANNERLVKGYNALKQVLRIQNNDPNAFRALDALMQAAQAVSAVLPEDAKKVFRELASIFKERVWRVNRR